MSQKTGAFTASRRPPGSFLMRNCCPTEVFRLIVATSKTGFLPDDCGVWPRDSPMATKTNSVRSRTVGVSRRMSHLTARSVAAKTLSDAGASIVDLVVPPAIQDQSRKTPLWQATLLVRIALPFAIYCH